MALSIVAFFCYIYLPYLHGAGSLFRDGECQKKEQEIRKKTRGQLSDGKQPEGSQKHGTRR
jgi:hypothetical protein